jgi:YD repeat-containing protein
LSPVSTRYEYDSNGNLSAVVDALGRRTAYEYDSLDRRVAKTNPAGARTEFDYDRDGHLIRILLPSGRAIRRTIDAEGRVLREEASGAPGSTFAAYAYDFLGKTVLEENDHLRIVLRRNSQGQPVEKSGPSFFPLSPPGRSSSAVDSMLVGVS